MCAEVMLGRQTKHRDFEFSPSSVRVPHVKRSIMLIFDGTTANGEREVSLREASIITRSNRGGCQKRLESQTNTFVGQEMSEDTVEKVHGLME